MNIDKALNIIFAMMGKDDPESKIISWVEGQENAQDIFDWFNKYMQSYPNSETSTASKYAFSFEAEMRKGSMPSEDQMMVMDKSWKGFYSFSNVIYELQNATDAELPKPRSKMVKKALDDLNGYLYSVHLPKPDPEEVPITIMEKPMTGQTKTYSAADFEALQFQLAKVQKDNQDTHKFSALKDRAIALNQAGKLSAAKYKAVFEGDQAFANYQAAIAGDPLESFLNYVDENITPDPRLAPSVYGATPILNRAVPERPTFDATDKSVDEAAADTLKNYKRKYGVK